MADTAPLVSVVVPTRNEAANVIPLWERLQGALAGTIHEVCFVDDSDDSTPQLLAELESAHPDVIRCMFRTGSERTGGLSTAVVAGLRVARGRYVCVMDSDLQHPPETINAMLEAAGRGADLVVASRYADQGSSRGLAGGTRRAVSRAATTVARMLFSEARRSTDPLSGYFLCRRELIDGIEFRPVGFKILLELLVCVPDLTVRDVPMAFESRAAGASKASWSQGLLFLTHLRSLFFEVEGSAKLWKFALVGMSGLVIFLPLLGILNGPAHLPALIAFVPAFAVSLLWNTALNRVWTFADQRRRAGGRGPRHYLERALLSGALMFAAFALLTAAHVSVVAAGALAAVSAMVSNGLLNRPSTRGRPTPWSDVATDRGLQTALGRLADELDADQVFILPPRSSSTTAGVPSAVHNRAVELGRPALWVEAPSHRHQRRTNIEVSSTVLAPLIDEHGVLGLLVCTRHSPRPFDIAELDIAVGAAEGVAGTLAAMVGRPAERGAQPRMVTEPMHFRRKLPPDAT